MLSLQDFTPTEQRILCKLLDEGRKPRHELMECVNDNEGGAFAIHLVNLRKKLRVRGYTVALIKIDKSPFYELTRVVGCNAAE